MASRPQTPIHPEVKHVLAAIRTAVRVLGYSVRDVEKKLGYSFGYLTRVFSGAIELKVEHVVDISKALEMTPEELLAFVYPVLKNPPSEAAYELWQRVGGTAPTGAFVIRKEAEAVVAEEDLERALRRTLGRVLADVARNLETEDEE
jgi:transcriptional regulator with XRE-family HTH domain